MRRRVRDAPVIGGAVRVLVPLQVPASRGGESRRGRRARAAASGVQQVQQEQRIGEPG